MDRSHSVRSESDEIRRTAQPVLDFAMAQSLVQNHGSPLLVASRQGINQSYQTLQKHLPGIEIFFAAKANSESVVLATLQSLGCSIDICSLQELDVAMTAGFQLSRIIHTHPCKSEANLAGCYRKGVRRFVFDNESELDKFKVAAPTAKLILRIAITAKSSLLNLSSKFGAQPVDAIRLLNAARSRQLDVTGLSFHLGSQCIDASDFDIALSTMRAITDEAFMNGFTLNLIDIGGGFAAAYGDQSLPPTKDYCDEVYRSVRRHFGDTSLKIIAEPGRILCAESVTLVTCVIGKTHRQGKPWYIIDDGIYGSFSGRRFSESDFKWLHSHAQDANVYSSVIAGPTCDSGDIVSHEQWLPDLAIGDILMVPSMGAYTSASAAAFNGMPLARTVMID